MRTAAHCSPLTAACHGEFVLVWTHHCIRTNEPVVYAQHRVLETYRTRKEIKAFHRRDMRRYEQEANNRYNRTWPFKQKRPFVMEKGKVGLLGMRLQKLGGWQAHDGGHGFCRSELQHDCKLYKVTNPRASLKAHDYHVLCSMVGQWAFDGLYKHPYEKVVQHVLEAMGNMLVKAVPSIEHEKNITTRVIRAVALLQAMLPSILLDHKWHQFLHIASDLPTLENGF